MGLKKSTTNEGYWYSEQHGYVLPKYHEDWDWLMPAIIKAQKELHYNTTTDVFEIKKESEKLANFLKNGII